MHKNCHLAAIYTVRNNKVFHLEFTDHLHNIVEFCYVDCKMFVACTRPVKISISRDLVRCTTYVLLAIISDLIVPGIHNLEQAFGETEVLLKKNITLPIS